MPGTDGRIGRIVARRRACAAFWAFGLAAALLAAPAASRPRLPSISFSVFAKTDIPLADVTWTGAVFLYATENLGKIYSGPPEGLPITQFVALPAEHEEYRCAPSPSGHGFGAGYVYCHAPHGTIYRLSADGTNRVFARLPETRESDGSIAFDTSGAYGHALLVATGGSQSNGGRVYAIGPRGRVRLVGSYPGPGGADGIELAPPQFGSASDQLLIAIDRKKAGQPGAVIAMSPTGNARVLVRVAEGLNPIVAVGRSAMPRSAAQPGLYVTDTNSTNVYFAAAASLKAFVGGVLVGSETSARFWFVRPSGKGFQALRLDTNLGEANWNLEGADYVS